MLTQKWSDRKHSYKLALVSNLQLLMIDRINYEFTWHFSFHTQMDRGGADWIRKDQDGIHCRAAVNMATILRVS
jgi:hypothetical protein